MQTSLDRFVQAQVSVIERVMAELSAGCKTSRSSSRHCARRIRIRPELKRVQSRYVREMRIGPAEIPIGTLPDVELYHRCEAREPHARLPHHQLGGIDACEQAAGYPRGKHRQQSAGAESDLEHPVTRSRAHDLDRPLVSGRVDPLHGYGKQPAADAVRSHRLTDSCSAHARSRP